MKKMFTDKKVLGVLLAGILLFANTGFAFDCNRDDSDCYRDKSYSDKTDVNSQMESMRRQMNRLFGRNFRFGGLGGDVYGDSDFYPEIDIVKKDNAYVVSLDLPGMEKDQIELTLEDDRLIVSGERQTSQSASNEEDGAVYYRQERSFGTFERSFSLPDNADVDNISAEYENGVLEVTVPVIEKKDSKGIKIEVR